MKSIVCTGLDFASKLVRKRKLRLQNGCETDFRAFNRARKRLWLDNRRLTIYTVTMLKQATIGMLKEKTVKKIKQEWRIFPQFKIDFIAELKMKQGA